MGTGENAIELYRAAKVHIREGCEVSSWRLYLYLGATVGWGAGVNASGGREGAICAKLLE